MLELIADILLVAGALGAGLYCFVLARRLKRFTDLEKGVGGAVAVLSTQADELRTSLESAKAASDRSGEELRNLTQRAEAVAQRLELMMASMHDVIPKDADEPEKPVTQAQEVPSETPPKEAVNADAGAGEDEDDTSPEDPPKAPEGVMFLRHARPQNGAAR